MTNYPKAYCVTCFDQDTLIHSSSGGVFLIIARYFITKLNGVVYGAVFEDNKVIHKRTTTISGLELFAKSKYIQSDLRDSFKTCLNDLVDGKYVFFVGTPCQINGLITYLEKTNIDHNRLLTCDLFCHGVPKYSFWEQYLKEADFGDISEIDFRYKKPSWESYSIKIVGEKKKVIERIQENEYFDAFLKNYTLMKSCYDCKFKGENRVSDFSIGDFWGGGQYYPEFYKKKGTSLIVIRNKNDFLLNIIKGFAHVNKVDYSVALLSNPAYSNSVEKPSDYNKVLAEIASNGFINTFKKPKVKFNFHYKIISSLSNFSRKVLLLKSRDKVGDYDTLIITDYGFKNFGNRLQNFALRHVIFKLGGKPANLFFEKRYRFYSFLRMIRHMNNSSFKRQRRILTAAKKSGDVEIRYDYYSPCKNSISKVKNIIVGSDQVWNWTYHKTRIPFNLAMLCSNQHFNKISYGASFGIDYIHSKYLDCFKEGLNEFNAVSVREEKGVELLRELQVNATLVLDPTLLVKKDDWISAYESFRSKSTPNFSYILKYTLTNSAFKKFDLFPNKRIIDVLDERDDYYVINHFDFVMLVANADLVFTDSYHAFIFALLFKKKIVLLQREEMASRFYSIFELLGLKYETETIIDLSKADITKLDEQKDNSIIFLSKYLNK